MLLDLGALVLEMHRHGRFLPDSLQRRAAEAVGTDAELRALSRSLEAGDGNPDLVAAGVAGNCSRCGALHSIGSAFCSQCGNELAGGVLPRKAALGSDPELAGGAPVPRRTVAAPVAAPAAAAAAQSDDDGETAEATQVIEPDEAETETETEETSAEGTDEPQPAAAEPAATNGGSAPQPPPISRRARATRVRQRLDEPSRRPQALPTGLLAGIAAGLIVIVVGILLLSSGDDSSDEPSRAQTPAQNEPEPPPPDEVPSPSGTPANETPATPAALEPVEDVTATAYDPSGDDSEHDEEAQLAVDGDASTSWPSEEYDTGSFQKDGVGLVLAPGAPVPARGLDIATSTPGFDVTIYGSDASVVPDSIDSGWTEIASEEAVERKGRIDLDSAGSDFSNYLIWITTLPGKENKVEIEEAQLLR
jgi:putative peptidoglycan lipid II flippase